MEDPNDLKLILNFKTYSIPSDLGSMSSINPEIYSTLMTKKKYEVKSYVSEKTFQFFIKYLVRRDIPPISLYNFQEYELLSQEFDTMRGIIQIFKKNISKLNQDSPVYQRNLKLSVQYYDDIHKLKEKIKKYQFIIHLLFNNVLIDNYIKILEFSEYLKNYANYENLNILKIYTSKHIIHDDIEYALDEKDKTAIIIDRSYHFGKNYLIPRAIKDGSQEYLVTSISPFGYARTSSSFRFQFSEDSELTTIGEHSFELCQNESIKIPNHVKEIKEFAFLHCNNLNTIEFSEDSELERIEKFAFGRTKIENITIPASVIDLQPGWMCGMNQLKAVNIIPGNKRYSNYENGVILGKSSPKSEFFDVLVYVPKDLNEYKIPKFIKRIASCAFLYNKTESIEISEDSELEFIEEKAFFNSSLVKLSIQSSRVSFEEGWFRQANNLKELIITERNKNVLFLDNSLMIGKSEPKSDKYDVIIYAKRDTKNVLIPSFVKRIGSFAFNKCNEIESFQFSDRSELESIGDDSFSFSSIESIMFPQHVTTIGRNAFFQCKKLKNVDFPNNTELKTIGDAAFYSSTIESIAIPSNLGYLTGVFDVDNLQTIKIIPKEKQKYSFYNNSYLLKKSDIKSDVFDLLVFARRDIRNAIIPSFIRVIMPYAFDKCSKLKTVSFEANSNLETISFRAFCSSSLVRISFPSSLTVIQSLAFSNCKKLSSVDFPSDSRLRFIESYSFSDSGIRQISIPSSVVGIGKIAFLSCNNLDHVAFKDKSKLLFIGSEAFNNCKFPSIAIPSSVLKTGKKAFNSQLKIIEIEEDSKLELKQLKEDYKYLSTTLFIPVKFRSKLELK